MHRPSSVSATNEDPSPRAGNHQVARFYDWAYWLYPLVDCFCASGRRRLIEHINQKPAGRLLEIGVGPGTHLELYRKHHLTAIDCSARMVASARRQSPASDVRQMDGEHLAFPAASYDYVTLCHVLSVTADPAKMLAEARRVLRPGGLLFILNHETPDSAWRHFDTRIAPLARWLRFRSDFRLENISGIERFRRSPLGTSGPFGWMTACCLQK